MKAYIYLGIAEFNNALGTTIVVVADDLTTAKHELFSAWRAAVGRDFQQEIEDYAALREWNGATVAYLPKSLGQIWEQQEEAKR